MNGNEVEETDAFGRKCTHHLTHPEYVIFVDEVGTNTNMAKYGNKGEENWRVKEEPIHVSKLAQMTLTLPPWVSPMH